MKINRKKLFLPPKAKKLMEEIHYIIGEDEFILYGSTPLKILLNVKTKIYDLDIAIKGINEYKIKKFVRRIKGKGFEIIEPRREYYIYKNKKVILVYTKNKKWFLDVAFLNDPQLIGQFNIESLYFRYPQLDYIDKFKALDEIKAKKIKLIRGTKEENPHLLLGRFLRLCAKYNVPLDNKNTKKILLDIGRQIIKWKIKNDFHKSAYISCISSLLKSILQSCDKGNFVRILINTSILKTIFPELEDVIKSKEGDFIKNISKTKTKIDIITLFDKYLKDSNRKLFREKIRNLKIRRWDEQDIKCSEYFG